MQRQNCLGNVSERQQLNLPELPPARFLVYDLTEGLLWMQSVASTVIFQVSEQVRLCHVRSDKLARWGRVWTSEMRARPFSLLPATCRVNQPLFFPLHGSAAAQWVNTAN